MIAKKFVGLLDLVSEIMIAVFRFDLFPSGLRMIAGWDFYFNLMHMEKLQIIYQGDRPHGIRNKGGFLLFFPQITKFPGQEERYQQELKQQVELANNLLNSLKNPNNETKLVQVCDKCFKASCWQGIFLCDLAQNAGTIYLTIDELKRLKRESSDYWKSDEELA